MSYDGAHVRGEYGNMVTVTCWFSKSNFFRCGKFALNCYQNTQVKFNEEGLLNITHVK